MALNTESKAVRLGVIGSGHWGRNLVRNFAALGALEAVADSNAAALQAATRGLTSVRLEADGMALIHDPALSAIAIATPAASHGALARAALEAGKHVFVEKPLCLDLDEASALGALADKVGRVLMVGHLLLYHPAYEALRAFVTSGQLGTLRYIYSNRASLGRIRREENALWSFAPHDVSMILSLIGAMPERVQCMGGAWLHPTVADTSLSHLTFASGVQAHIFVSWLHPYKEHRLVVVGTESMAVFDDVEPGERKLVHYPHIIGFDGQLPTVNKADAKPIPYGSEEPLRGECAHFLDCVTRVARPISDAREATRVLSVLDACQRALSGGVATSPRSV